MIVTWWAREGWGWEGGGGNDDDWGARAGEDEREVATDETELGETEGGEAEEGWGGEDEAYAKEGDGCWSSESEARWETGTEVPVSSGESEDSEGGESGDWDRTRCKTLMDWWIVTGLSPEGVTWREVSSVSESSREGTREGTREGSGEGDELKEPGIGCESGAGCEMNVKGSWRCRKRKEVGGLLGESTGGWVAVLVQQSLLIEMD
jgi:hypothetical protein